MTFDQVIVADAQEEVYKADGISRRRLYTALSRAMHHVMVVSQGKMTPLLQQIALKKAIFYLRFFGNLLIEGS